MYRKPRRILLKFGSGILTRPRANALDDKQFRRLTADVAQLVRGGCECIIVSSGAVAAGMRVVGLKERPLELTTGQACAAVVLNEIAVRAYFPHKPRENTEKQI